MPDPTFRARHVKYTAAGLPVVRRLPNAVCADSLPDFQGARHVAYTTGDRPILGYAYECCDAFCTPAEVAAGTCYKLPDCWPLGEGPGITYRAYLYVFDAANCLSARNKRVLLLHDSGSQTWTGSLVLIGGTLDFVFACNAGVDPADPGKFALSWSGCDVGSVSAGYTCSDPLSISFPQHTFTACCLCGSLHTDTPAELAFVVVANCRRVAYARHVGYAGQIPIVAREKHCNWDVGDAVTCEDMTCGLVMTVTDAGAGECACLVGTYHMDRASGLWVNDSESLGGCTSPVSFNLNCITGDDGSLGLILDATCGATNTGTGSVLISGADWDNIDVTITVPLADPSAGECTGAGCTYTYNAMAATWELTGNDCTDPNCNPCPNGPLNPPADPVDGQTYTEDCTGSNPPPCCIGTITARITREPAVDMAPAPRPAAPPGRARPTRRPLLPVCQWQGDEVPGCKTCGGPGSIIYYCNHADDDADRCVRGPSRDKTIRSCLDCPHHSPGDSNTSSTGTPSTTA